jgi:hypothetical protein
VQLIRKRGYASLPAVVNNTLIQTLTAQAVRLMANMPIFPRCLSLVILAWINFESRQKTRVAVSMTKSKPSWKG